MTNMYGCDTSQTFLGTPVGLSQDQSGHNSQAVPISSLNIPCLHVFFLSREGNHRYNILHDSTQPFNLLLFTYSFLSYLNPSVDFTYA